METRKLEVLVELSRLGSMRLVAERVNASTSAVSQQIASLSRELGVELVEPVGRGVRLTPAGRRFADHAVDVLASLETARAALQRDAEPAGEVRIAGFATAINRVMPLVVSAPASHPDLRLQIHEHEPADALELLAADRIDLAIVYDYNLDQRDWGDGVVATPLWEAAWGLGVPAGAAQPFADAPSAFAHFSDRDWIVNSRNEADDNVIRAIASIAGFRARIVHRVDTLHVVQELIAAGLGVGLLPVAEAPLAGVAILPLDDPTVVLRAWAITRTGSERWPALRFVLDSLTGSG